MEGKEKSHELYELYISPFSMCEQQQKFMQSLDKSQQTSDGIQMLMQSHVALLKLKKVSFLSIFCREF